MTEQDKQALIKHFCSRDCGEAAENCEIMPCWEIELIQEFPTTEADSDTISRQAAIDCVMECYDNDELFEVYEDRLNELPPAQLGTNLAEVGTDCISRQALLDKFEPWLNVKDYNDGELNMLKAVLYEIRFMPPAQPEPKKGKWIRNGWAITCSECGYDMPYTVRRFCPNCGADMREVTE